MTRSRSSVTAAILGDDYPITHTTTQPIYPMTTSKATGVAIIIYHKKKGQNIKFPFNYRIKGSSGVHSFRSLPDLILDLQKVTISEISEAYTEADFIGESPDLGEGDDTE